jgi:hypothetical protein
LTQAKRDAEANKIEKYAQMENNLKNKKREQESKKQEIVLQKKKLLRSNDQAFENNRVYYHMETENSKIALERRSNEIDRKIKEEINKRDVTAKDNQIKLQKLQYQLETNEKKAEDARSLKKANYDLEKELLDDPTQRKLKKMEAVKKLYKNLSFGGIKMNMMSNENPVSYLMTQFDSLFEDKK